MKKRRLILTVALALMFTVFFSSSAMAVLIGPNGNTSWETAIEIQRNAVTPESKVNADTSREYFAGGTINPGDQHWYKVYMLPSFDSILSVNADGVTVEVFSDPTSDPIFRQLVMKDYDEGIRAYDIPIEEAGMYYIRLRNAVYSGSYRVSFGNPNYNLDNVTVEGNRITLHSGETSADGIVSFAGVETPDNAFVYQVVVNGTRSARPLYETRSVNCGTGFRQTNSSFLLTYSPLVDIDNIWMIRWGGTARTTMTFDPEVTFYYAYQVPLTQWD